MLGPVLHSIAWVPNLAATVGDISEIFLSTGLFEMIAQVLTTCHTQYT